MGGGNVAVRPQLIRLRKPEKGDLMLCIIIDTPVNKSGEALSKIKSKIKAKYISKAGKFSPPLEIKELGTMGKYSSSLVGDRERTGLCIISDVGANPEFFEWLSKEAVNELKHEGYELGGVTFQRPVFEVFGD